MTLRRPSHWRGGARRGIEETGQPVLRTPMWTPACDLWWETDDVGATIAAGTPSVFTTLPNRGLPDRLSSGGTFGSLTTARPAVAQLQCGSVSRQVATFDDTDDNHISSLPAVEWIYSHQAWTWMIVVRPTAGGYILATHVNAAGNRGCSIEYDLANERVVLSVSNGTAYVVNHASANSSVPVNTTALLTLSYSDAAGYDIRVNGSSSASGAVVNATDAGNPDATLYLGSDATPGNYFGGQLILVLGYSRVLAAGEIASLEATYAVKYQTTAVPLTYAPTFWFRGDLGVTLDYGNAEAGDQAAAWADQSGNAHDATQATDSKQLTLDATDADFDNEAALEGGGGEDCMSLSAGVGWPAGTDHTFIAVFDQQDASGVNDFLLDPQTGRLIFAALTTTAGQLGVYDGGWRNIGNAAAGPQALEFHLDAAGNSSEAYRAGVYVGASTYPTPKALGGAVAIFSRYNSTANFLDGKAAELWHRDSLLTGADLYTMREYIRGRYPTVWGDWTPVTVPDCSGWWSMKNAGDRTVTSGRVVQLNDKSGLGRHLIEAGAKGPTYEAAGWNGKPSMLFNGTDMYLYADAVAADVSGDDQPLTVIMAAEWVSHSTGDKAFSFGHSVSNDGWITFQTDGANLDFYRDPSDGGSTVGVTGSAGASGRDIYSVVCTGTAATVYINGASDATGTVDVNAVTVDCFALGCQRRSGANSWFGNIRVCELMVYKRALSTTERTDIEAYLTAEWTVS